MAACAEFSTLTPSHLLPDMPASAMFARVEPVSSTPYQFDRTLLPASSTVARSSALMPRSEFPETSVVRTRAALSPTNNRPFSPLPDTLLSARITPASSPSDRPWPPLREISLPVKSAEADPEILIARPLLSDT